MLAWKLKAPELHDSGKPLFVLSANGSLNFDVDYVNVYYSPLFSSFLSTLVGWFRTDEDNSSESEITAAERQDVRCGF